MNSHFSPDIIESFAKKGENIPEDFTGRFEIIHPVIYRIVLNRNTGNGKVFSRIVELILSD